MSLYRVGAKIVPMYALDITIGSADDLEDINELPEEVATYLNILASGIAGPPAGNGGGIAPVNFSYGDPSPATVFTAEFDCLVHSAKIIIDTPYNGVGAFLSIGTFLANGLVMPESANFPYSIGSYTSTPEVVLLAGQSLYLFNTPGVMPTQGSGKIIFSILTL